MEYDKVEQTVIFGSVFESLYAEFITIGDVLKYLLKREYKNDGERKKLCIAYRIICMFDKEQFVENKNFISLTNNDDYIAIYLLSFGTINSNINITQKLQKFFPKLENNNYKKFYYKICDLDQNFNDEDGEYIAKLRNLKHLKNCTNIDILLADYLDALDIMDERKYFHDLLNRCCLLRKAAPLYWNNVAYKLYRTFVEKKYNIPYFSKESMILLCECFPNLYSEKVLNRSQVVQRIYGLNKIVAAYYLGFPIHEYIPSAIKIEKTLDLLDDIGTKKYLEQLINRRKLEDNVKIVNLENVHYDKIDNFNSFDVVNYYTDSKDSTDIHLFRFTRPEFVTILKDKKNFYTGEPLPKTILEEIKTRIRIAKEYKLPKAMTIDEFLKDADLRDKEIREQKNIPDLVNENDEENNEDEEDDDEEENNDEDERDFPYFVGKVLNENGEESFFRLKLVPELQEMDSEELENIVSDMVESRGMEYLGRVECNCDTCGRNIVEDVE